MDNCKYLFIGAGKMATAIAGGMIRNDIAPSQIQAFDVSPEAAEAFTLQTGSSAATQNIKKLITEAKIIILAIKPQHLQHALNGMSKALADKLIISIMAGTKLKTLQEASGTDRVIRVMPNTPAMVGAGASAFATASGVNESDIEQVEKILGSCGEYCRVPENLMDAVTGLSGSGPAYVFEFIQALADGGVNAGIPRDAASRLAAQTVLGAAKLVLESGEHPIVLRDKVTSPGGTTARGLGMLENGAFRGTVIEAVLAAAERSAELGNK